MFDHLPIEESREDFAARLAPAGLTLDHVGGLMTMVYRDDTRSWMRHLRASCRTQEPDPMEHHSFLRSSVYLSDLLAQPRCPVCATNTDVLDHVRPAPSVSLARLVVSLAEADEVLTAAEGLSNQALGQNTDQAHDLPPQVSCWADQRRDACSVVSSMDRLGPRELLPVGPPLSLAVETTSQRRNRAQSLLDLVDAQIASQGASLCGDPGGPLALVVGDTDWSAPNDRPPSWGSAWTELPMDPWLAATLAGRPAALAPVAVCDRLVDAGRALGVQVWWRPCATSADAALQLATRLAASGMEGRRLLDTTVAAVV